MFNESPSIEPVRTDTAPVQEDITQRGDSVGAEGGDVERSEAEGFSGILGHFYNNYIGLLITRIDMGGKPEKQAEILQKFIDEMEKIKSGLASGIYREEASLKEADLDDIIEASRILLDKYNPESGQYSVSMKDMRPLFDIINRIAENDLENKILTRVHPDVYEMSR